MIKRTATLNPSSSEPCPRFDVCTYKDKGKKCQQDRGGDCFRWWQVSSFYVWEEV